MKYAFYTGCVAKGAGRELYSSSVAVAKRLGIELHELTNVSCCGAGVISEKDPLLSDTLNARTFAIAEELNLDIMNICGTCQGVMMKAQKNIDNDAKRKEKINEALKDGGHQYKGSVKIKHLLHILIEDFGLGVDAVEMGIIDAGGKRDGLACLRRQASIGQLPAVREMPAVVEAHGEHFIAWIKQGGIDCQVGDTTGDGLNVDVPNVIV